VKGAKVMAAVSERRQLGGALPAAAGRGRGHKGK